MRPIGRVVGSIVSIGLLLVAGYTWYQYRDLDNNVSRLDVSVGAKARTADEPDIDGQDQNIFVVGNDDRSNMSDKEVKELHVGRDGGSLATDTMMIVHVPADGSRATLISLPRDTMVDVPDGYGTNKLNAPYALAYSEARGKGASVAEARKAGANLLLKTVTKFTGLSIDHYVQIDLLGFYRLSTAIGGVPINLCNDVDDRHKTNVARGEDGGSGLHLSKGKHVIEGKTALEFVRQRHGLPRGDFDRVKRQQYFLTSAFRQVASVGILFKLRQIGDALKRSVYFDNDLDLLDLARQLENLTANNIVGKTIPVADDGTASPKKVKRFVAKVIGKTDESSKKSASSTTSRSTSSTASSASKSPSASSSTAIDSKCIN
ncbi:transcriptional attenuator, LytR family [Jatrophihabitans endophyticus]|uniref:Transcriptional attenuator, LytR family n=1 Tax=Jatrophihabitans endophyticus TaxID=1206085 RepID=A0A1M5RK64_9ACTN|nr:transcriptional attenuator, LytR family [Jatrophihabitans endophyticus]